MQENKITYYVSILKMAALAAIFCFGSCEYSGKAEPVGSRQSEIQMENTLKLRLKNFHQGIYGSIQGTAQSGDLITRMGTDMTSLLLSRINKTDTSYSHCGIVSIENDSVFVYHSIGGEFNPDQKMKREWLYDFAHPRDCRRLGIFSTQLNVQQQNKLINYLKMLYQQGLPFDMAFDLKTDDRMYCSELVAKSISKALGVADWFDVSSTDSISYISIENLYTNNKWMKEKKRFVY